MVQVDGKGKRLVLAAFAVLVFASLGSAQEDPPDRVARLNYTDGDVSMLPAGVQQWLPGDLNRPFTAGDSLYTGDRSVAELHLDNAVVRMGQNSDASFLNLNDHVTQVRLSEGDLSIGVYGLAPDEVLEVDTPNAALTLLRPGSYRIHVDPNAQTAYLAVHDGQAEINGNNQAFTIGSGNGVQLSGVEQLAYDVEAAPPFDVFDSWCADRDRQEQRWQSDAHALPQAVIGGEDLPANGAWTESPDYGPVWYPQNVPADWAPYQDGHWAFVQPWGWTWISRASWGFAPFHYGRWVWWRNRWGWAPGPVAVRGGPPSHPVYAPALVAWLGSPLGGHPAAGVGPTVGWVPLGPGEVYTPAYHCSPAYFQNINVRNTRIVRTVNITNVYQTVYVHRTVYYQQFVNSSAPHGVVVVPSTAVAAGHSIRTAVLADRANGISPLRAETILKPAVQPVTIPAYRRVGSRPVAQPERRLDAVPVFARTRPGADPVAALHAGAASQGREFSATNHMIERKGVDGAPLVSVASRQAVRLVGSGQPIAVHPGMHNGIPPSSGQTPRSTMLPAENSRSQEMQRGRPSPNAGRQGDVSGSVSAVPFRSGSATPVPREQQPATPPVSTGRESVKPPLPASVQRTGERATEPHPNEPAQHPRAPESDPASTAPHRDLSRPSVTGETRRGPDSRYEQAPERRQEHPSPPPQHSPAPPHPEHPPEAASRTHDGATTNQHSAPSPASPPPSHNEPSSHGTTNTKSKN